MGGEPIPGIVVLALVLLLLALLCALCTIVWLMIQLRHEETARLQAAIEASRQLRLTSQETRALEERAHAQVQDLLTRPVPPLGALIEEVDRKLGARAPDVSADPGAVTGKKAGDGSS